LTGLPVPLRLVRQAPPQRREVGSEAGPENLRQPGSQAHADRVGCYRRDHLRALAQRGEVDAKEIRIMRSKSVLLRTLAAAESAKTADFGVPSFVPKWRARRDSNS
jgi:site-specific DNA recombinase